MATPLIYEAACIAARGTKAAAAQARGAEMLWTIVVVILILWLLGFSFHVAGGLIHLLLVVALIVIVINLITGRR